jgi:hypothetical protein
MHSRGVVMLRAARASVPTPLPMTMASVRVYMDMTMALPREGMRNLK